MNDSFFFNEYLALALSEMCVEIVEVPVSTWVALEFFFCVFFLGLELEGIKQLAALVCFGFLITIGMFGLIYKLGIIKRQVTPTTILDFGKWRSKGLNNGDSHSMHTPLITVPPAYGATKSSSGDVEAPATIFDVAGIKLQPAPFHANEHCKEPGSFRMSKMGRRIFGSPFPSKHQELFGFVQTGATSSSFAFASRFCSLPFTLLSSSHAACRTAWSRTTQIALRSPLS